MSGSQPSALIARLGILFMLGLLAGCARGLPPVDHGPVLALSSDTESFVMDQRRMQLDPDSPLSAFQLLDTGRDAFTVRAALIEAASHRIDAQYYIWNDDDSGRYLAGRLVTAADRGVQVRLLLDDINVAGKESLFAMLEAHPNIAIRIFNPSSSRNGAGRWLSFITDFDRINRRMHNKTFVVDDQVGIAGGRNIGDEYFDEDPQLNFRDRDVMVLGPLAADMTRNFEAYWNNRWAYPLSQLYKLPDSEQAVYHLSSLSRATTGPLAFKTALPRGRAGAEQLLETWFAAMIQAEGELVFDPPPENPDAPANTPRATANALFRLTEAARSEILIESAYLILAEAQLEGLDNLNNQSLRVTALTNSLATNDLVPNHSGYARWRRSMLEQGITLHELRPDAPACKRWVTNRQACDQGMVSLHSKAVVFDRETLFIGSFNVNLRSIYLNGETVLIIRSPELARTVAEDIDDALKPENSWQVTVGADGRMVWTSQNQEWHREPEVGFWRRAASRMLSWLPIEKYL
ncbi:phospholipase D family protein [Marinobacter halophilus]|uniref:Phospholipase n=1 Tax=Marinobacter halophilus TaxID=1323740 RepID=A0A2T1K9S2_9GAMM|nr:phospholipase D family protein [Marinobacter halophilus]PSF06876.1 phospholipase [Marinobacter halophilus]GGC76273.1 phospholipase D family protein [Marinobacter halophilus]